ncbi:hypothetical protein K438DRAFT_1804731 [Mycena galopus ATCC 62051]|nr:hypothetical protein K438DRAFT_1804731 [Mycena galopus ATCC 62051]
MIPTCPIDWTIQVGSPQQQTVISADRMRQRGYCGAANSSSSKNGMGLQEIRSGKPRAATRSLDTPGRATSNGKGKSGKERVSGDPFSCRAWQVWPDGVHGEAPTELPLRLPLRA